MNTNENREELVRRALAQLENPDVLPADPHFSDRVIRRIAERRPVRDVFLAHPRPAFLVVLVLVNLAAAIWFFTLNASTGHTLARRELIEMLSGEAGMEQSSADVSLME
jgi:hypothetical protein